MSTDITQIPEEKRKAGRPKGAINKTHKALKEKILDALDAFPGGAAKWLEKQRDTNPKAFMQLLARILPTQLTTTTTDGKDAPLQLQITLKKPE
jgi:hypothetical protein